MHAIVGLGLVAFLVCLLTTPLVRDLFVKLNIVDHPDGNRKLHVRPIPRVGGIPIALSYAVALGLMLIFAPAGARIRIQHEHLVWALLPATALIFVVGLVDDLRGLRPWQKLGGQAVAAALAVGLGARMAPLHGGALAHGTGLLFSFVWLIGCTNAVNLIDGLDGLASGVGLFATGTTLIAAILAGNTGLAMATVPLVGCLMAFLLYNFAPASVFLGDSGSLTIGFMLGCFGLIWSQKSGSLLGMAAPLMALALPLVDVGLSIGRRFMRSRPIFGADRGHIHHMVLALGFKPRAAALILYGFCGLAAFLALLLNVSSMHHLWPLTLLVFCAVVFAGVNALGYPELSAMRRTLSKKRVLRALQEEIYLHELDQSLTMAETPSECWDVVRGACLDLRFATVRMYLKGESFEERISDQPDDISWEMTLSLGRNGHLRLTRMAESKTPVLMMSVLHLLQESITGKTLFVAEPESQREGVAAMSGAV